MKLLFGIIIFFLSCTSIAFGAESASGAYVPMVGVPGLANASSYTTEMYVDAIFKLAITVGGILAVIQIIFGGVMYMFDGVITHKEAGKDKIKGAIFGLLIILGAVLLLQTVNPDLLKINLFGNAPPIDKIVTTRNTPAPIAFGNKVLATTEGMERMKNTCKGNIVKEQQTAGKGAKMEYLACYAKTEDVNAKPGDTFDISPYNPKEEAAALEEFAKSCGENGGVYDDNIAIYSDTCSEKIALGEIKTGSVVSLVGKSQAQQIQAKADFKAGCAGTVIEGGSRGGLTLTCQ